MRWSVIFAFVLVLYYRYSPKQNAVVLQEPFYAPGWKKVADTFRRHVESGWQLGGAFAVYYKGELVVECAGGYADEKSHVQWTKNTVTQYFSTTKAVSAIVMAMLVERGLLDYNEPISTYWPQFGKHGKEDITVLELLTHRAGLAVIDEPYEFTDILDYEDEIEHILASQAPAWKPGEEIGYHAVTLGLYEDHIVRKVDPKHRSLSQFFNEEIAQPFGIDFFIGLPKEENYRCARNTNAALRFWKDVLHSYSYWPFMWSFALNDSYIHRSVANPTNMEMLDEHHNNPRWREVPNASSQGFGTVSSITKLLGILANGGQYGDYQLLSEKMIESLQEPVVSGYDIVVLRNMTYGKGLTMWKSPMDTPVFGAPGATSTVAKCDPQNKLAFNYLTNYISLYAAGDDPRFLELEDAVYTCLDELQQSGR